MKLFPETGKVEVRTGETAGLKQIPGNYIGLRSIRTRMNVAKSF